VPVNIPVAWFYFQVIGVRGFRGHVANMARIKDDEGENWPSLEAARAHAVMIASELWQDGGYEGYAIYVTDDQGKEVAYFADRRSRPLRAVREQAQS
jgi:hypothetical protein